MSAADELARLKGLKPTKPTTKDVIQQTFSGTASGRLKRVSDSLPTAKSKVGSLPTVKKAAGYSGRLSGHGMNLGAEEYKASYSKLYNSPSEKRAAARTSAIGHNIVGGLASAVETGQQRAKDYSTNLHNMDKIAPYKDQLLPLKQKRAALLTVARGVGKDAAEKSMGVKLSDLDAQILAKQQGLDANVANTVVDQNKYGQRMLEVAANKQAEAKQGLGKVGSFVSDATVSIGSSIPAMAVSVVAPEVGLPIIGATAAGQKSHELSKRGIGSKEAWSRGVGSGLIEAGTEAVPIAKLAKLAKGTGGKQFIKGILEQSGTEATEESIAYTANFLADKAAKDPEAKFSLSELGRSAAMGAMSGVVLGGAVSLGNRAVNAQAAPRLPMNSRAPVNTPVAPAAQKPLGLPSPRIAVAPNGEATLGYHPEQARQNIQQRVENTGETVLRNADEFDFKTLSDDQVQSVNHIIKAAQRENVTPKEYIDRVAKPFDEAVEKAVVDLTADLQAYTPQGVSINQELGTRMSNNEPWYSKAFAENGRAPNKAERAEIAREMVMQDVSQENGHFVPVDAAKGYNMAQSFREPLAKIDSDAVGVRNVENRIIKQGDPIKVFRGSNRSDNATEKNLAATLDIMDVIGRPKQEADMIPLSYFTDSESDAQNYADHDKNLLKTYEHHARYEYRGKLMEGKDVGGLSEDDYSRKHGAETYKILTGRDAVSDGSVNQYTIKPKKTLDLTKFGETGTIKSMYSVLSKATGISENALDDKLILLNLSEDGGADSVINAFSVLRNRPGDDTGRKFYDLIASLGFDSVKYKESGASHYAMLDEKDVKADTETSTVVQRGRIRNEVIPNYSPVNSRQIIQRVQETAVQHNVPQETIDRVSAIASKFNAPVEFVDTLGDRVNGKYENGKITIAKDTPNPIMAVFTHELTHHIESTGQYDKLSDMVKSYIGKDFDAISNGIKEIYAKEGVTLDGAGASKEAVAAFIENRGIFEDEAFINRLTRENPSMARKILDWITDAIKKVGASADAKFLVDARRLYEKAMRDGVSSNAGSDELSEFSDTNTQYSIRTDDPPKKTMTGYKVFVAFKNKPGQLFPPMVANPNGEATPLGVWLDADEGAKAKEKDGTETINTLGRFKVKAGGKGTQGGSGSLAYRPGWHLGEYPMAKQFARLNSETGEKDLFPENFVWAECEFAADVDYQQEAMSYGYNSAGNFQHSLAGLPKLPENGYYRYRTNPDPSTEPWYITGSIKVTKILDDSDTNKLLTDIGVEPMKRKGGEINLSEFGLSGGVVAKSAQLSISDRLNGDALLDAEDMIDDLKSVGATVDSSGYVTAYHRTSESNANAIRNSGKMKANEDGVFFSTSKNGQADGFGDYVLEFHIPVEKLKIDDIFSSEAHLRLPLKSNKDVLDVSTYLRDSQFSRSDVSDLMNQYIEKYGAIKQGENPHREVEVPKKTPQGKTRQFTRTMMESKAIPDSMIGDFEREIVNGTFAYAPMTDKAALASAENTIKNNGFDGALKNWDAVTSGNKTANKNDIALGETLLNQAANAGDVKLAMKLAAELAAEGTRAGQNVQAFRLLKKMTPDGQLYYLQKTVQNLNDDLLEKLKLKAPKVKISEELTAELLGAKSKEEIDTAVEKITQDIADQVPPTWLDKWNAWRYLSMLGNPRTHIRNLIGNGIFIPAVKIKNLVAIPLEARLPSAERTKAVLTKKDKVLKDFAAKDFASAKDAITSGGKLNPTDQIRDRQTIFKTKPLEWARKANMGALEAEDALFLKMHYSSSFAQVMKARGLTPEFLKSGTKGANKALEDARNYAIQEAQKATYRDASAAANAINRFKKSGPVQNVLGEGLIPFTKTPINILKRGIEYSPVGIITGTKTALVDVKNGTKTASQAVDQMASGLTGTGILVLGAWLASMGLVSGGGSEDKKESLFDTLQGAQNYALKIGGYSYTLDWAAPSSLPLFVGVEIFNMKNGEGVDKSLATILDSLTKISEPMVNMSMLQGMNNVFKAVAFGDNPVVDVTTELASGYFGQAVPTLAGQIARTVDDTRRTRYVDKNSGTPEFVQKFSQKQQAKLPFASKGMLPYMDAWGREQKTESVLGRVAQNFISPGYVSKDKTTNVDKELDALYKLTGEVKILPSMAAKFIRFDNETKNFTADEYFTFASEKGKLSYSYLDDLISSGGYKSMTNDAKIDAITSIYDYAGAVSKAKVSEYKLTDEMQKVKTAEEKGIKPSQYFLAHAAQKDITGDKDAAGDTIDGTSKSNKREAIDAVSDGLSDENKMLLYDSLNAGLAKKQASGYETLKAKGMSESDFMRYLDITNNSKGLKNQKTGRTISGTLKSAQLKNLVDAGMTTLQAKYFMTVTLGSEW